MLLLYCTVRQYAHFVWTCVLPQHSSSYSLSFFHRTAFTRLLSLFRGTMNSGHLFILGASTFPRELVCICSAWNPTLAFDGSSAMAKSVSEFTSCKAPLCLSGQHTNCSRLAQVEQGRRRQICGEGWFWAFLLN